MQELATNQKAKLRITMKRSFDAFGDVERDEFLKSLAKVTGCGLDEMGNVHFHRGCVVSEVDLPEQAVRTFLELFEKISKDEASAELEELVSFIKKECIQNANAEYAVGIVIKKKEKHDHELVFVHGGSGRDDSFGRIPDLLGKRFSCPAQVYEYSTGWLSHSPSIYFVAQSLDNWFRNHIRSAKVALIAHSMGGLAVRKFIVSQAIRKQPLDGLIKQITFIASPHNGAVLADIGKYVPSVASAQVQELSPKSGFVPELNDHWQNWLAGPRSKGCQVRSIFGTADKVVTPANARGLDTEAVPIDGATHTNIVEVASEKSEIVLTLSRFLVEAGIPSVA